MAHTLSPAHFFAAIAALMLYVAPFVYSSSVAHPGYQASGLGMVFRENIQRFYAPFDHKEPFWVYFKHTPTLFLPWSVLLILALIALIPRWKQLDDKTKWLLKAAALIFLFFTASGSRRNYYILPLIPFCALLTAIFLTYIRDAKVDALRKLGLDIQQVVLGVIIALDLACPLLVPIAFKIMKKTDIQLPPGIYAACISIGIAAVVVWIVVYNFPRLSRPYRANPQDKLGGLRARRAVPLQDMGETPMLHAQQAGRLTTKQGLWQLLVLRQCFLADFSVGR